MAISLKSPACFLQLKKSGSSSLLLYSRRVSAVSIRKFQPMATLSTVSTVGLSETFACLKEQGKIARHAAGNAIDKPIKGSSQVDDVLLPQEEVALIPYITAGDPDLSTTGQALKVLDSCGSDIIELGVPYSDPLADGPVIQAAATRSLARGTNFDAIIKMLKEVVPELSCPIALFSYYNPILKRGVEKFMSIINDAGVHGLVVPDVPLEETAILRKEATKYKIELVLLTTPTTPSSRMKAIVEASEGFVYLVSSVGVTGARASVSERVQTLLQDIKGATNKPVAVGFGISKPEHVKQVASWGADGVIVGSAMVKLMGEAKSPEEGLEKLESFTRSLKSALI